MSHAAVVPHHSLIFTVITGIPWLIGLIPEYRWRTGTRIYKTGKLAYDKSAKNHGFQSIGAQPTVLSH